MAPLHLISMALPWVDLSMDLSDSLETLTTFATQLQTVVSAAISHPIWAIAAVVLTIVLIQIIADLVKRILKTSLAFVLKLPLLLSQWIWRRATMPAQATQAYQIEQLIARLEALRSEEAQVVLELKTLLAQQQRAGSSPLQLAPDVTAERKSSSIVSPETG